MPSDILSWCLHFTSNLFAILLGLLTLLLPCYQVAIRNNQLGVAYFNDTLPLPAVLLEDGKIEGSVFVGSWKSIPEANEVTQQLPINMGNLEGVKAKLAAANMFVMAYKQVTTPADGALFCTTA